MADVKLGSEREKDTRPTNDRTPIRVGWNWFGALFGVVVLLGGSILYLNGGSKSASDGEQATTQQQAVEPDPVEPMAEDDHDEEASSTKGSSDKKAGGAKEVIEIEMIDFGYVPETIEIPAGTPVILRFTNNGEFEHEAMIGDAHMQEEFAEAGDHDDHGDEEGGHHGDAMAVSVMPGETADLEVMIDEPGEWFVACHLVGHYEQGQIGNINVTG